MNNTRPLWPVEEAGRIIAQRRPEPGALITLETGFGPSGAPHIGTYAEIIRTNMVRRVLEHQGYKTRMIVFCDDKDGLRRVPSDLSPSEQEEMQNYIGYSLHRVPDPNALASSFGQANCLRLMDMCLEAGFTDIECMLSSDVYASGLFNAGLRRLAEVHDKVCEIVRATLSGDRQENWSPFMPVTEDGRVLTVPIDSVDVERGVVCWRDDAGVEQETSFYDGNCKIQWKADWAMRWFCLGIDYEMAGKDLIDSVSVSTKIVRAMRGRPPVNMIYELFLMADGAKYSKSKGGSLTLETWRDLAPIESMEYFVFDKPKTAHRIFTAKLPEIVSEFQNAMRNEHDPEVYSLPWFIQRRGYIQVPDMSYQMMVNLASVGDVTDSDRLMTMIGRYQDIHHFDETQEYAEKVCRYYEREIRPGRCIRTPTDVEKSTLVRLASSIESMPEATPEEYQTEVYTLGKEFVADGIYPSLRDWFKALYETILGADSGPRFGDLISLYGTDNMVCKIKALASAPKILEP